MNGPTAPPNPSVEVLAAILGQQASTLNEHGEKLALLVDRANVVDMQLAVWKGQLRLLAAIAGLVGGGVGGVVATVGGAL